MFVAAISDHELLIKFLANEDVTGFIKLEPNINTPFHEYCPNLSPDGGYFFFTSNKKGNEDIYWIKSDFIEKLRIEIIFANTKT